MKLEEDLGPQKTETETETETETSLTFQCYVCGETNESKTEIVRHIKTQHYKKVKDSMFGVPRNHQCPDCKIMFLSTDSLGKLSAEFSERTLFLS